MPIHSCIILLLLPLSKKTSIVSPIFKQSNKCDITNYRPIVILQYFSKLLEKLSTQDYIPLWEKESFIPPAAWI